jgi:hypothetical protein
MTTERNILDLEDLARRYDPQILREYLQHMDSDASGGLGLELSTRSPASPSAARGDREENDTAADTTEQQQPPWAEVFDLRPRCIRRLRIVLVVNFLVYWSSVAYCGFACQARVQELGLKALPPLEVGLLGVFVLGTQATVEFAAAACLTQPARAVNARSMGFRAWDFVAWIIGAGARCSILLDVQVLPLLWCGSHLLFFLSASVFAFAIGIFVFIVQLRLLCGLFSSVDQFAYDKPDLFFKGRDPLSDSLNSPLATVRPLVQAGASSGAARDLVPSGREGEEQEQVEPWRIDRPPSSATKATVKVANVAHLSDLALLHAVITRLYVPLGCQESQEFVISVTSFSRCFCEDIIQCSVKFFFLMDCEVNIMVLLSLFVSAAQALASCFYASTSLMDIRSTEETTRD